MKTPLTLRYIFLTLVAVIFTWMLHEFAHWAMGELLGYEMKLSLNAVSNVDEKYTYPWHKDLVSLAGPVVTIIQALVVFFLLTKRPVQDLFPFLFTPFYMRIVATIVNFFNINDEGRVSESIGLGPYVLPFAVSIFLFLLVLMITRKWAYSTRFIVWTTLLVILFSSILILTDQYYHIRLL